ncbi:MAG: pseudouridine synthase [Hyphomicrobiales bacterium]
MFIYNPPLTPKYEIIFADDDMLVLNKQSGLLSVPGRLAEHKDSLYNRVLADYPTAQVVHRLDMDTSGIIIMPLHKAALSHISKQFQARTVSKTYFADVFGVPDQASGSVDLPLIFDPPNRPKQKVCHETGKASLTHYEVLNSTNSFSRVKLMPVTGRSHQLRVHMQAIGHPIVGDSLYAEQEPDYIVERLHLHAFDIGFLHPRTEKEIYFSSPVEFEKK